MRFDVWLSGETRDSLQRFIKQKARVSFSRYEDWITHGQLRLRYEQRSRGAIAYCSLDLNSVAHGVIHVHESSENDFAAVSKAMRVAQATLKRNVRRRKDATRRRKHKTATRRLAYQLPD